MEAGRKLTFRVGPRTAAPACSYYLKSVSALPRFEACRRWTEALTVRANSFRPPAPGNPVHAIRKQRCRCPTAALHDQTLLW